MFVMALLKMYGATTSHNMLMATTKPNAAMYAFPLEYIARQIAWTTHFFNHSHIFSPDISDPVRSKLVKTLGNRDQSFDKLAPA